MMKSVKAISIGGIATLVIAVTLSIFFLADFEKTTVIWWALAFVLLSEILLFIGIAAVCFVESLQTKVFLRSGIISVLSVYFLATAISCLFANAFTRNVNGFIIIEMVFIAAMAIIVILLVSFSYRAHVSDQGVIDKRKLMQGCENRIYNLMADSKLKDFETELGHIYEKIKYSDKIGISSVDYNIVLLTGKLEKQLKSADSAQKDIHEAFDELSAFLAQRNMEIEQSKRGGF